MPRVFNFSPGPAMLPESVVHQAHAEFLDWHGTGMSVMELPHRGDDFKHIAMSAETALREVLAIPDNYHVLFMPGGSHAQYAALPLNLLQGKSKAAYVSVGHWACSALDEAEKYVEVVSLPDKDPATWALDDSVAYCHYVDNETVDGFEYSVTPSVPDGVTLVADMSSNLLSRPVDISQFGVIYACAQKNLGIAGITVVIIREDLVKTPHPMTPGILSYQQFLSKASMPNTPPTYPWYMLGLVCDWIKSQGGLLEMDRMAKTRSHELYAFIDANEDYINTIDPVWRSRMNVIFTLKQAQLTVPFLEEAAAIGLKNLKGHRVIGGIRASMYNAMPIEGTEALVAFMRSFVPCHVTG